MVPSRILIPCCVVVGLLVGGCGETSGDPTGAQDNYGAPVDATDAFPVPAVTAEDSLYRDRALAIDGRIVAVRANGCEVYLAAGRTPLVVTAARTDNGSCAWRVPADTDGFAVAAGTLRAATDTLRLTANGVQVTPVRLSKPDS